MKEFIKKNFAIVLAFTLPIILIIIVALSAYLPSLFLSTNYNFIYASCTGTTNTYDYTRGCTNHLQSHYYSVVNNKLVVNTTNSYTTHIFLHDTKKNESREITLEEALTLTLNSLLTSSDGVTVSSNYDRGADFFFIFDGGSSYGHYLTKGKSKRKLNLINDDNRYYYRDNFKFIGWVLPGRS